MRYLLLALSLVTLVTSCNKDPEVPPSKANQLRAKKWTITGGTLTVKLPNGKDTSLSYLNFVDTCYLDDYIKFDSNYAGSVFTGDRKCNVADPASRSFTWRLLPNETFIDLFSGFNMIFCVNTSIEPYKLVTGEQGTDTVRELRYTPYRIPSFDLYGAEIIDFTPSSFKLKFSFKSTRLDSTGFRAGAPNNNPPAVVADTADYLLTLSGN
ncbi:MAG: hypothetical protein JNM41_00655 [Flavipsychrobacter sp.]|nr:hypothetical protein [Flavipsychrobacter sp.]